MGEKERALVMYGTRDQQGQKASGIHYFLCFDFISYMKPSPFLTHMQMCFSNKLQLKYINRNWFQTSKTFKIAQ